MPIGERRHLALFQSPFQTNVSWAMQYGKLDKEDCLKECNKINHEIPSMNFIETEKLKSVKKETDFKIVCYQQFLQNHFFLNINFNIKYLLEEIFHVAEQKR